MYGSQQCRFLDIKILAKKSFQWYDHIKNYVSPGNTYKKINMVYSTNSGQDRLLSSVIFIQFYLFYFPRYNAIISKSGNIETVFWATVCNDFKLN